MQVLLVTLAGRRYAVPSASVEEVVPRTRLAPVDGASPCVAGLMDHRGSLLPVIDGSMLLHGQPSPALLGSRIVVMSVPAPRRDGTTAVARFGLLCDLVTERAALETEGGAWRSDAHATPQAIVGVVGRVASMPMPLIDPARIVAAEPLLIPASAPAAALGAEARGQGSLERRA